MLADTGVFVSELCLGAMTFGGRGQMWEVIGGLDQPAVDAIVHRSLDAGINFIDTADVYSAGESETMVGKALAGRRQQVVLATKVRGRMGKGPNEVGLSRLHIQEAVDASSEAPRHRLHRPVPDPPVRFADQPRGHAACARRRGARGQGALHRLFEPCRVADDEGAGHLARAEGLERFRCTQSYYSLAGRELEREIVPLLKDQNLGLLVWSPLAGGFLSGKFTREGVDATGRRATFDFPPLDKERGLSRSSSRCGPSPRRTA